VDWPKMGYSWTFYFVVLILYDTVCFSAVWINLRPLPQWSILLFVRVFFRGIFCFTNKCHDFVDWPKMGYSWTFYFVVLILGNHFFCNPLPQWSILLFVRGFFRCIFCFTNKCHDVRYPFDSRKKCEIICSCTLHNSKH
jgi:hypothetical protein